MDGALAKRVRPEKDVLVQVIAELEAGIDFAEDEVEPPDPKTGSDRISAIGANLQAVGRDFSIRATAQ